MVFAGESRMELKQFFLEQLEAEAAAARKVLERVPEGQNAWKPHERSMELGYLAALVATMPGWIAMMVEQEETDLYGEGKTFQTKAVETRAELLALLDQALTVSRRVLGNTTEDHLLRPWRLKMGAQILTEGPRYVTIANGALSHLAHHRGQLTVYLRLNGASVPAIYGPSADERH